MADGEISLEPSVGADQVGIGAQSVAEGELLVPAGAGGRHQVQVRGASVVDDLDVEPAVGPLVQLRGDVVPAVWSEDGCDRVGGAEI